MKDEEMAEEYLQSIEGDDCVIITDREERKQAFLAGLKAGRPQWHKVAEEGLPKIFYPETFYLLWTTSGKGGSPIIACIRNGILENIWNGHTVKFEDIVEWKECDLPKGAE